MRRDSVPRVTTILPMWPSAAGTTTKSAGVTGALQAHPAARAARSSNASLSNCSALGLVDLDHEFRAAHTHDRRRSADLHRFGRLLDHLARHRGESALL